MDLLQEGADIRHQAERNGIIAADLFRIDVDMDQPRRRNGEGVAGNPGTRGAVVEAHAKRQQHVGLPRRVIGLIMPGARDETKCQRMVAIDCAHAAGRSRDRNLQAARRVSTILPPRRHSARPGRPGSPAARHRAACRPLSPRLRDRRRSGSIYWRSRHRVRRLLGSRFHEHVKGHVEHDRAGPARRHGLPGLPHRERHHLAARRLEHLLAIERTVEGKSA